MTETATFDLTKVYVVIAAYNEERMIEKTIASVQPYVSNIIVVDDCSRDDTSSCAANMDVFLLRHPINLGQGAALQTGIEFALKEGAEYIVTFDADGQHQPEEILPMLQALCANNAEVALGSRFLGRALDMSAKRRILLKLAILFGQISGGGKFTDAHNGFRVLSRTFAKRFQFRQNRMAHASEIQAYITRQKIKYIEHPVTIAYTEYSVHKGQKSIGAARVLTELFVHWIAR